MSELAPSKRAGRGDIFSVDLRADDRLSMGSPLKNLDVGFARLVYPFDPISQDGMYTHQILS